MISRRQLLQSLPSVIGSACLSGIVTAKDNPEEKKPTILLVSSWQTVNIGDIGHTPGILRLLESYLPEARIILWANSIDRGVEPMLRRNFPAVEIIQGKFDDSGTPGRNVRNAFNSADFLLHGSGPGLVAVRHVRYWSAETGKPYGVYGVTISDMDDSLYFLLSNASFIFTRETSSLDIVKKAGVSCPVVDFAPDAAFGINILNEEKAGFFLESKGLREREFICVVPRLRRTPYYKIHEDSRWSPEKIKETNVFNNQYCEQDFSKLREVIVSWVRETGLKVLLCPEMTYQLELFKPYFIEALPRSVKKM